jgi:transcriptional regulator with XRE-family HTH domain
MEAKTKINNRLWQARHRAGLEQKQAAHLLGHKTLDQISRYERGDRLPSLRIAFKLEIIYRTPLRELFPELYERYRIEIADKYTATKSSSSQEPETPRLPIGAHICTYENLLFKKKPNEKDINLARRHSIKLMRQLGDVIDARKNQSSN